MFKQDFGEGFVLLTSYCRKNILELEYKLRFGTLGVLQSWHISEGIFSEQK